MTPLRNDGRGAAAVEFALGLPVLLVMLLGIMQLGMLYHANSGIRELAGWAGRRAIIDYQPQTPPTVNAFQATISSRAAGGGYGIDSRQLRSAVTVTTDSANGVRNVTITLDYPYRVDLPLLPGFTINLSQTRTYYAPIQ